MTHVPGVNYVGGRLPAGVAGQTHERIVGIKLGHYLCVTHTHLSELVQGEAERQGFARISSKMRHPACSAGGVELWQIGTAAGGSNQDRLPNRTVRL